MNIGCVYHSIDLDGWMSAAIVKHWNRLRNHKLGKSEQFQDDNLTSIGYNYGEPIPDLSRYDKIIMCDISFPRNIMETIHEDMCEFFQDRFIWIDHHISAINENYTEYKGIRDTKFAACELTWNYFFPNETIPEIVRLLGRYDCFGHKGTLDEQKVLEFQYGARQRITNYNDAFEYLQKSFQGVIKYDFVDRFTIEDIIQDEGRIIYKALCVEAMQAYKNRFSAWLVEPHATLMPSTYKFTCINKERFNPINFGIDYHSEGYDGACCFHYDGKTNLWRFSLYNDNGEVDCSKIAKQYGGGGHKGAAGFVLSPDDFNRFMTTNI